MKHRQYSRGPQRVDEKFWYYEQEEGLDCIYKEDPAAEEGRPITFIPWSLLDGTFERRYRELVRLERKNYEKKTR